MEAGNIYSISELPKGDKELFDTLFKGKDVRIERIVSSGQTTPANEWYDQPTDEWVILIQGSAKLEWNNGQLTNLEKGSFLHIPAHCRHRVVFTSHEPHCIWIAIHFNNPNKPQP